MSNHPLAGNPYEDARDDFGISPEACATLALAYEQRTASLIAYYALWNQIGGHVPSAAADLDIKARLGLDEVQS